MMHVPDAEQVLREMRRVVRPGGRIAVSVWDTQTPHNGFGLVYVAVRAHGNLNVPLPHGADFFQFGTVEKMHAALTGSVSLRSTLHSSRRIGGFARPIRFFRRATRARCARGRCWRRKPKRSLRQSGGFSSRL